MNIKSIVKKSASRYWKLLKHHNRKAIVATAAVAFAFLVVVIVNFPVDVGHDPIFIQIEGGDTLSTITDKLKENGVIRNEFLFMSYVRLTGGGKNLKAGKYTFSGKMSIVEIAEILDSGLSAANDIRLLVSEGFNIWEIDDRLVELGLIEEGEFSSEYYNEEGYLFPDTYRINGEARGKDFVGDLRQRMRDNFNEKTAELFEDMSSKDIEETLIIASILEKEARSEGDMHLVSGIIHKRLELGMLLQVDASVIYGACRRIAQESDFHKNCEVTFQGPAIEIPIDGPYNTYTRGGLPRGPISNPGIKAINAALNPTESNYLYYLTPRGTSDILYSATPAEHEAKRRQYLGL